jgi:hypothetical protein
MGLHFVVELSRQVRSIKHSHYAADDRRDHRETDRPGAELDAAEDRERAAWPTDAPGARSKLMTAARSASRSDDESIWNFVPAIVRIARSARGSMSFEGMVALRALFPLAETDWRVVVPLQFAADWYCKPKILVSASS